MWIFSVINVFIVCIRNTTVFKLIPLLCTHVYSYMFSTVHPPSPVHLLIHKDEKSLLECAMNYWHTQLSSKLALHCTHQPPLPFSKGPSCSRSASARCSTKSIRNCCRSRQILGKLGYRGAGCTENSIIRESGSGSDDDDVTLASSPAFPQRRFRKYLDVS